MENSTETQTRSHLEFMMENFVTMQTNKNEEFRNQNLHINVVLRQLTTKVESLAIHNKMLETWIS